jgi:glycosyltransferase involved in cell wall biosynthesis
MSCKFSIAIPTHDRGEVGTVWLRELFESLKIQTFRDFDIVISDQSKNDSILDVCKDYSEDFEFTYIKYQGSVPCENINIALENCSGDIIKIMFSDDIFVREDALDIIQKEYEKTNCKWAFSGFCGTKDGKTFYDHKVPQWTDYMLEGRNLLSSPSVVSFLNEVKVDFDENLKLLLDTDFYHRMRWENGLPHIIEDVLVANRDHDNRISSHTTSQYDAVIEHPEGNWLINTREYNYIQEKYKEFVQTRRYPDEK